MQAIGSYLYRDLHNLRDNTCSSGGTTICHVPEKQYLCSVITSEWTSLTEVSSGAETFSTSSFFLSPFERSVSGGPGDLSPKIRDFRGLHKGKAMRSDEDSLRRLVAVSNEQ